MCIRDRAWTLIYTLRRIQAPQTYILRLQQTPNDTNRRPQKPNEAVQGCAAVRVDMEWRLLVSVGVWWCLLVSYVVWRCEEGVWGVFSKRIWVLFMDVCTVSLRLRVYMSVLALYGAENAIYWKSFERQNSMHLTLLKHQNTKTSLYKLSKNGWVCAFF